VAIAYKSAGAGFATATSGASLACVCPATVDANDILLAHIYIRDLGSSPATPSGWTLLDGPRDNGSISQSWIFGKLAAGTEDGAAPGFGTNPIAVLRAGRIYSYSGWTSGTITQNVAGFAFEQGTTAAIVDANVTTPVAGSMAVNLCTISDDLPAPSFDPTNTSVTGGTWVEPTAEFVTGTGLDGTLGIQNAIPTSDPGTIGGGTFTRGAADTWNMVGFYIRPDSGAVAATSAIWRQQPSLYLR
jgi:hypothetical protein